MVRPPASLRTPRALDVAGATIAVTGASGFVGEHLVRHLKLRFPQARILRADRAPDAALRFDLNDPATATAIVGEEPDVVVHLAGESSISGAGREAGETWRVNLLGTLALARALADHGRPYTFLFASSAEVYGRAFASELPVTEASAPQPMSVYGRCKFALEAMLTDVVGPHATLVVVRPSNHVGPGQAARFALPSFARQIAEGERRGGTTTIKVGSLNAERDFLDVRDVVSAYGELIARLHNSGRRAIFNVSSGVARSVRSMLDMLVAEARISCQIEVDQALVRPSEIPKALVSPRLIEQFTCWKPQYPLEQTVADILDDARQRQR